MIRAGDVVPEIIQCCRAKIEQLQQDRWQHPQDQKIINTFIEAYRLMIYQHLGSAGILLNGRKLVNAAGSIVGIISDVEGGFDVFYRMLRKGQFEFVSLGRVFSADDIKELAVRLSKNVNGYITKDNWQRIARGLGAIRARPVDNR
jgi:hypothetical protein